MAEATWEQLLDSLAQLHYRAAIIGPKGSGKTTLLEALATRLESRGLVPVPLRLDAEHRRLAADDVRALWGRLGARDVMLLDGAEQMSWFAWWRFERCSHAGGGLVITSHRAGRLPTLFECQTTPALLDRMLDDLLAQEAVAWRDLAHQLYERHQGNLRAVLRSLYDEFAQPGAAEIRGRNGALRRCSHF